MKEEAFKIMVELPDDGLNYQDAMSRILRAVSKELVIGEDRGALCVRGVDIQKEAKELADLRKELEEYRDGYNKLRALRA